MIERLVTGRRHYAWPIVGVDGLIGNISSRRRSTIT